MVFLILVGIGIQGLVLSIFGTEITTMGILESLVNPEQLMSGNTNEIGSLSLVISVISGIFLLIIHYFIGE